MIYKIYKFFLQFFLSLTTQPPQRRSPFSTLTPPEPPNAAPTHHKAEGQDGVQSFWAEYSVSISHRFARLRSFRD